MGLQKYKNYFTDEVEDAPVVLTQDILPSVGIGTDAPCILGLNILPSVGIGLNRRG
jgi:hypothetical protein